MKAILAAAALCLCLAIGVADTDRDAHLRKMLELKGVIEAIPRSTDKREVADLLHQLQLPYHTAARKDFRYDSGPSMVRPVPEEADSAYVGSGGGRPGYDDDFVYFVVLFDREGKTLATKAKVLGYW